MPIPQRRRILHTIKLTEISGVDRPCQEGALVTIMKRAPDAADQQIEKAQGIAQRVEKLKEQSTASTNAFMERAISKALREIDEALFAIKTLDAELALGKWDEAKHPRAADGKFGSGSGSGGSKGGKKTSSEKPSASDDTEEDGIDWKKVGNWIDGVTTVASIALLFFPGVGTAAAGGVRAGAAVAGRAAKVLLSLLGRAKTIEAAAVKGVKTSVPSVGSSTVGLTPRVTSVGTSVPSVRSSGSTPRVTSVGTSVPSVRPKNLPSVTEHEDALKWANSLVKKPLKPQVTFNKILSKADAALSGSKTGPKDALGAEVLKQVQAFAKKEKLEFPAAVKAFSALIVKMLDKAKGKDDPVRTSLLDTLVALKGISGQAGTDTKKPSAKAPAKEPTKETPKKVPDKKVENDPIAEETGEASNDAEPDPEEVDPAQVEADEAETLKWVRSAVDPSLAAYIGIPATLAVVVIKASMQSASEGIAALTSHSAMTKPEAVDALDSLVRQLIKRRTKEAKGDKEDSILAALNQLHDDISNEGLTTYGGMTPPTAVDETLKRANAALAKAGNPNHDEHGRFSSGSSDSSKPKESTWSRATRGAGQAVGAAASLGGAIVAGIALGSVVARGLEAGASAVVRAGMSAAHRKLQATQQAKLTELLTAQRQWRAGKLNLSPREAAGLQTAISNITRSKLRVIQGGKSTLKRADAALAKRKK